MIHSLYGLAVNNLKQYRLRTALSAVAVALGVAMVVATDVIGSAMRAFAQSGDDGQSLTAFLATLTNVMLTAVGLVILAAAAFLVFNAFAMSVTQRRQQIGALRALGMTRGQVMRLVLTEALVTGGLGTALGLAAGPVLGQAMIGLMQQIGGGQFFAFGQASASPGSLIVAAALGMGVTLLAVLLPARAATRVAPLAALRAEAAAGIDANPARRAVLSVGVMAVMAVYLAVAPPGDWVQSPWNNILVGLFALVWLACLVALLPGLVGALGKWTRKPLTRRWGATGRLVADNLQRGRRRVTLTILTLATGLTMIVTLTGVMTFLFKEALLRTMEKAQEANITIVVPYNPAEGVAGFAGLNLAELQIPPEVTEDVRATLGERADLAELYIAFPPELAVMVPDMFSYVIDAQALRSLGAGVFRFTQGSWETAMPVLEAGCGLLISPQVAQGQGVKLGDPLTITSPGGPLDCAVAGIGVTPANISIVSGAVGDAFPLDNPIYLMIIPRLGADAAQVETDIGAALARHNGVWSMSVGFVVDFQGKITDALLLSLNAVLLLAIVAAALGVVNTTIISVTERRQELGLLRAVGCTKRQARALVAGEAALMGLVGGALGLVAGAGLTIIMVVVGGVNAVGLVDFALWPAAWRSVAPALLNGLVGLMAAPLIAAGAAWLPARAFLRGTPIETLMSRR